MRFFYCRTGGHMQNLRFMFHVKTYFKPLNFAGFPIFGQPHFASSVSSQPSFVGSSRTVWWARSRFPIKMWTTSSFWDAQCLSAAPMLFWWVGQGGYAAGEKTRLGRKSDECFFKFELKNHTFAAKRYFHRISQVTVSFGSGISQDRSKRPQYINDMFSTCRTGITTQIETLIIP